MWFVIKSLCIVRNGDVVFFILFFRDKCFDVGSFVSNIRRLRRLGVRERGIKIGSFKK